MPDMPTVGLKPGRKASERSSAPAELAGSFVSDADRYVRSPVDTRQLERDIAQLARLHQDRLASAVQLDTETGQVALAPEVRRDDAPAHHKILPWRLGAMRRSLQAIEENEPWLGDRQPTFYLDDAGKAHIDYINLAGFVVDAGGKVLSRSVNPF
jgi:hypothetical protein